VVVKTNQNVPSACGKQGEAHRFEALSAEALALRAQEGSKTAFTELVRRFGPRLYHYFRRRLDHAEDCEDLVQETLAKAYRNIDRYRLSHAFSTWIFTIGTRRMLDHLRTRARPCPTPIPPDLAAGEDPADTVIRRDERDGFWALVRALPGKQYNALWLRYVEGLSIKEIARTMKTTRVHTKVLLYRARTRLAKTKEMRKMARTETDDGTPLKILSCE
jgi:RNA polymerase sigma-70 factor (ECF subfamily)